MSGASDITLEVNDLTTRFGDARTGVTVVDGVSFNLRRGRTTALVGESGCGKSATALSLMGPSAVVRIDGVTVLLTSRRTPPFDLGQLRSQGIIPEKLTAIGVKAAVAHRRAYDPIARGSYTVATPGPCSSALANIPYRSQVYTAPRRRARRPR